MRRLLALGSCVLVGLILGAFLVSVVYVHAGSRPTATQNGDTNGDGTVDISDAVHLLSFLFLGGPEIATLECPPVATLVATGQTQCAGDSGLVDCSIPKARGQDGAYHLGCPFEGRFTDNHDGTVTDHCTGLMWTKNYVDVDGDGEIIFGQREANDDLLWADACRFAEDMTYLGHDDWRVPNIHELLSIIDFGNALSGGFRPYGSVFDFLGSWASTHAGGPMGLVAGYHVILDPQCPIVYRGGTARLLFAAVRTVTVAP